MTVIQQLIFRIRTELARLDLDQTRHKAKSKRKTWSVSTSSVRSSRETDGAERDARSLRAAVRLRILLVVRRADPL